MNTYTNTYFLNKKVNELKRIETMLKPYPNNVDLNQLDLAHIMLKEEQKKLRGEVERSAFASGLQNPLETDPFFQVTQKQPLSDNNGYVTNNSMYNPNQQLSYLKTPQHSDLNMVGEFIGQSSSEEGMVSPEERQRACEALKPNGCGPAGWKIFIADNPDGFDFTLACNNHDRKYGTIKYGFEKANDEFYREMLSVLPLKKYRYTKTGKMIEYLAKPDSWARIYYNSVKKYGQKHYDQAQQNARICKYGKE